MKKDAFTKNLQAYYHTVIDAEMTDELSDLYVPLQGSHHVVHDKLFDVRSDVTEFLSCDSHKALLIQGLAGSGKSMFCKKLYTDLWTEYLNGSEVVPLYINLPGLGVTELDKNIIDDLLIGMGFARADIEAIKQQKQFVFILDSYDELECFKDQQLTNLYIACQLDAWSNAKFIYACRTTFLNNIRDHRVFFAPGVDVIKAFGKLREIHIAPFDESQILDFITRHAANLNADSTIDPKWAIPETYLALIDDIPGVKPLIQNPFLLKATVSILPLYASQYQNEIASGQRKEVREADLIGKYIEFIMMRQLLKMMHIDQHLGGYSIPIYMKFAMKLAVTMDRFGLTSFEYDPEPVGLFDDDSDSDEQIENPFTKFFDKAKPAITQARSACPIRSIGKHRWAFFHSKIQDYLVAQSAQLEQKKLRQQALYKKNSVGKKK